MWPVALSHRHPLEANWVRITRLATFLIDPLEFSLLRSAYEENAVNAMTCNKPRHVRLKGPRFAHPFVLTKFAAGIALVVALLAASASARDLVIHAGTLLDGVTDTPRREVSIRIQNDRITAIEPGFVKPAGSEIIDLSGQTVMPGFIDCHVHIASRLPSRMVGRIHDCSEPQLW